MARPTHKTELICLAEANFQKLFKLIDALDAKVQAQVFAFEDRDRNVRDVLTHLYDWHQLLLQWVRSNSAGQKAHFLPEPYTWKTYPAMNIVLWENHQSTSLIEAVVMLKRSHGEVLGMIDELSNEALFVKKFYSWTGSTSLGAYCISATSSHYDWALKKLRKHQKSA